MKILRIVNNPKVKSVWTIAVIFFSLFYFTNQREYVSEVLQEFKVSTVTLSLILILLAKVLLAYNQLLSQKNNFKTLSFKEHFYIYNFTQLAKYIPGIVWQFVGKAGEYAKRGLGGKHIRNSLFTEIIFLVAGSASAGLFFTVVQQVLYRKAEKYLFLFLVIFGVLFILLRRRLPFIRKLNIAFFLIHLLIWLLIGTSFYILAQQYLLSSSFEIFLKVISFNAFSFTGGYIVFFAPGGIGIRELTLTFILSGESAQSLAVVVAMHRGLYLLVEFFLFMASKFLKVR